MIVPFAARYHPTGEIRVSDNRNKKSYAFWGQQRVSSEWGQSVEWSKHLTPMAGDHCSRLTALLRAYIGCPYLVESSGTSH